jgi:hypothetical protein
MILQEPIAWKCFDWIGMQVYASSNWGKSGRNLGFQYG